MQPLAILMGVISLIVDEKHRIDMLFAATFMTSFIFTLAVFLGSLVGGMPLYYILSKWHRTTLPYFLLSGAMAGLLFAFLLLGREAFDHWDAPLLYIGTASVAAIGFWYGAERRSDP